MESYPGISLVDFDPNWPRHRALSFDAFNPQTSVIRLALRIDDRENPDYPERFNGVVTLAPGKNHVVIPFSELLASGSRRRLDFRKIDKVILFVPSPTERLTIYPDNLKFD